MSLPREADGKSVEGVALQGMLFYGAAQLATALLSSNATGGAALRALIAEWGMGRIGVAWSDPFAPPPTTTRIVQRALWGGVFGLAGSGLVFGFLVATRAVRVHATHVVVAPLLLGLVTAALEAVHDELFLRGFLLRLLAPWSTGPVVRALGLLACGLAEAAAWWGRGESSPATLATGACLGVAFGALWQKDRGAWLAWGAHVGWAWATQTLLTGALVDARSAGGTWAGSSLLGGWASTTSAALFALTAVAIAKLPLGKKAVTASRS